MYAPRMAHSMAPVLLVHGGAGDVPEEARAAHAEGCRAAAAAGLAVLLETGSALAAVVRAVEVLEDDPRFNAESVANIPPLFRRSQEVGDDIDPLFFHAQRRNLGERRRLDEADFGQQRLAPAPLFQLHRGAGRDGRAVPGEHFHDDLQVSRVADLHHGGAGGHHACVLLNDLQHAAVDRRLDLDGLGR